MLCGKFLKFQNFKNTKSFSKPLNNSYPAPSFLSERRMRRDYKEATFIFSFLWLSHEPKDIGIILWHFLSQSADKNCVISAVEPSVRLLNWQKKRIFCARRRKGEILLQRWKREIKIYLKNFDGFLSGIFHEHRV